MESRALRRGALWAALLVALLAATGYGVWQWQRRTPVSVAVSPPAPDVRAPSGVRIRVEVVNATKIRGLARRATLELRDHGFDVVATGTSAQTRDSTLVLDRSGHPEWAKLVSEALGGAAVQSRPDSSRYLDVTVLLGASWRPSAKTFNP